MKNTLTIAITKYYTFKTTAKTMDVAFDEYQNTTPAKAKYKDMTIEPVEFYVKPAYIKKALNLIKSKAKKCTR